MSELYEAVVTVQDLKYFLSAERIVKNIGCARKDGEWVVPEVDPAALKAVVEYPAGLPVAVSGSTSAIEKTEDDLRTRRANTVTDINKRLDALEALVTQAFKAVEVTRDKLDHRTENLGADIEALKESLESNYALHDYQQVAVAKLSEAVKSLSVKLEDAYTIIDKLTERVDQHKAVINGNTAIDEKRAAEQKTINSALSERVSDLEDGILAVFSETTRGKNTQAEALERGVVRAIQHMLRPGGLLHKY